MGKVSLIGWCDATHNPWRGCTPVSPACDNCYAARRARRFKEDFSTIVRSKTTLRDPLNWQDPKMIFVGSLTDFFHEDVPPEWRREAWEIMYHAKGNGHTFLILTKRPENIASMLPVGWIEGQHFYWPHIWFGVTAENQAMADLRIPLLLPIPAARHFVSVEPMLGFVDMSKYLKYLDWVIAGGESGSGFRVLEEEKPIDLRDQCVEAGVKFFFKQWSGIYPKEDPRGTELDGRLWEEKPEEVKR